MAIVEGLHINKDLASSLMKYMEGVFSGEIPIPCDCFDECDCEPLYYKEPKFGKLFK